MSITSNGSVSATGSSALGISIEDAASATIDVNAPVSATGTSATGIKSVSQGSATINIGSTGSVFVADPTAFAISSTAGTGSLHTLNNAGTITGNIALTGGTVAFNNLAGGTLNSGLSVDLAVGGGLVLVGPSSPAGTGVLTNAGTLSPGGHGATQTTALTGNYVQTATGVLKVDADWTGNGGTGAADRLVVTGTAVLAGTVVVNPMNFPTTAGLTKNFHILTAYGGITNNGITIPNTAAVNYALHFGENTDLFVRATINFQSPGTTGLTENQNQVGGSLNTIFASGTTLPFMTALMTLPAGSVYGQALNQLAPAGDAASNSAAMATSNTFAGHLLSCRSAGEEGEVNRFIKEGQCVWARVSARRLDNESRFDAGGYRETATFYTAGAQLKVAPDWRIGGGLGYEISNLATDASASSATERLHLGGVVKYTPGPLMLAASVTGGFGWHDNIRHVAFGGFGATATSNNQSSFVGGRLTAAYLRSRGALYLKPQVELAATHLMRDGYSEHANGGIGLRVKSADTTVFSVSPSLELGVEQRNASGFVTRAFVKGGATVRDANPFVTNATFIEAAANMAPFAISSRIDKVTADLGAGLDLISANDTTLRLQYDGQFGERTTLHSGGAKLSVKF